MDQLKKIFAGAVKHQFWIITSVAALMACVAWFMYSSSLKKQFEENAKTIAEKFNAMQTVSSAVATHPNEHSITEMTKIIDGLASDVETAWSLQYKRQEQFLKWREEKLKMPLLISKLKRLYPIELKATYPDEPKNPLISNEEKRRFSQYFAEQMPELAKIIGVTWVGEAFSSAGGGGPGMGMGDMGGMGMGGMGAGGDAGYPGTGSGMGDMGSGGMGYPGTGDMGSMGMGSSGMGGMGMGGMGSGYGSGMGMMMGPQSNDVVIWSKASQSQLLTSLKMWQGDQPTVFQMMYTQENMWILEGIFNIIAKTNLVPATGKPATANFQATVKEIEFIRIGRDAVANAGSITGMGGGMGMGGMGMGGMGMGDMGGMGMGMGDMSSPGGMSPDGGSEGSASGSGMGDAGGMGGYGMGMGMGGGFSIDPADRRYVDAAYKPITGEELRTKITSQNAEDAYFAVAKRIPVRLKFKIDYSQLQRFLANCGNEGLMLEVRQVRVGQFQDAAAGGYGGMGGGMGGMPGMGGGDAGSYGGEGGPGGMGMGDRGSMGMGMGDAGGMGDMGSSGMGYPGTGMGDMGSSGMGGMGMGGMGMGGMGMGGMGMGGMKKPDELTVEVYGIVYLFNPANIDSLGLNKVTEDTEIKDTVSTPPEEPVAAPPVDSGTPSGDPAQSGGAATGASAPTAPSTPSGTPTSPPAGAPTSPPAGAPTTPPTGTPPGSGSTPAPTGS